MKQPRLKTNQLKSKRKDILNVQLDLKCICSSPLENNANMQFARRYLQCQSAMPIRTIRLFIESIMPYSRMIKISLYDSNDRLLKDSDRLCTLKHTLSSSNYIPLSFTLINTITSFAHCSCLSPSIECNSSSTTTIDQILSTCSVAQSIETIQPAQVNVLKLLPTELNIELDEKTINQITLEFGEICPSLPNLKRCRSIQEYSMDMPLDLSMKSHSLTSATKWIKT